MILFWKISFTRSEEIMQELTKPCFGYNQVLVSLRENRNTGLEHAYKEINNIENNHTLQLRSFHQVLSS